MSIPDLKLPNVYIGYFSHINGLVNFVMVSNSTSR